MRSPLKKEYEKASFEVRQKPLDTLRHELGPAIQLSDTCGKVSSDKSQIIISIVNNDNTALFHSPVEVIRKLNVLGGPTD
jgi:hypothetical protein